MKRWHAFLIQVPEDDRRQKNQLRKGNVLCCGMDIPLIEFNRGLISVSRVNAISDSLFSIGAQFSEYKV